MNERDISTANRSSLPLSVVIITENEQDRIDQCIESVIDAADRAVPAFEIIVVDSASEDRTIDVASEYPVTILRIPEEHTVSCGAGRFVGDHVADGDLVCHVDGDMRLSETWLAEAVEYLRTHDDVAGVEGWLNESGADEPIGVPKVGGVMCYDADRLASIGGFDPFLVGYEDIDVGFRLTVDGYRLVRLPSVSAEHPTGEGTIGEPVRRWRHGYMFASGQAIRKSLGTPRVLWQLLTRQKYKWILLAWLGLGVVSVFSVTRFFGWVFASTVGFGALAKERGVSNTVQFLLAKSLGLVGLFYGLSLDTKPADTYPLSAVELIQNGAVLGADAPRNAIEQA